MFDSGWFPKQWFGGYYWTIWVQADEGFQFAVPERRFQFTVPTKVV